MAYSNVSPHCSDYVPVCWRPSEIESDFLLELRNGGTKKDSKFASRIRPASNRSIQS